MCLRSRQTFGAETGSPACTGRVSASSTSCPAREVKCIEDLREKREELNRQIMKEEEDKGKIQKELSLLTDRDRGACLPPCGWIELGVHTLHLAASCIFPDS